MKLRIGLGLLCLIALAGCTPANEQYCQQHGVSGAEFNKCIVYYNQQQAIFDADRDACEMQADLTYPRSLYDYGRTEHVMGGFGYDGRYYGGTTIQVSPDYQHNAQVDSLRARIVAPCMDAKGWNSVSTWQAGRHAVAPVGRKPVVSQKLPWQ